MSSLLTRRKHAHECVFLGGNTDVNLLPVEVFTPAGDPEINPVAAPIIGDLYDPNADVVSVDFPDDPNAVVAVGADTSSSSEGISCVVDYTGSNQFTYDASATGLLYVPVEVSFPLLKVEGAKVTQADFGFDFKGIGDVKAICAELD